MNDKIEGDDGVEEIMSKLSEGNPGALTALTEVLEEKGPEDFFKFALRTDMLRLYGPKLWIAFSDYYDEDPSRLYEGVMNDGQEVVDFVEDHI